jgi:hypothetical protein
MKDKLGLSNERKIELLGFALGDCTVEIDPEAAKYLRAVHRTALELAVPNQFGVEVGGFWLMADQISQLRKLPEYYSAGEAPVVAEVVETYLSAQLDSLNKND